MNSKKESRSQGDRKRNLKTVKYLFQELLSKNSKKRRKNYKQFGNCNGSSGNSRMRIIFLNTFKFLCEPSLLTNKKLQIRRRIEHVETKVGMTAGREKLFLELRYLKPI
jgi:hypothetical protein